MTSEEIAGSMVRALEAERIPYMLVGSLSSSVFGIPRSTKDADFVIDPGDHSIRKLLDHLGSGFRLDPQISFESVTMTIRHIFEVPESEFKIELFQLSDDAHDRERLGRRQMLLVSGIGTVWVASAEDVIITKLNWLYRNSRGKDREDVRDVLAVQGSSLDFDYIHGWCDRHGTRPLLDEIRASIPEID